MPSPRKGESHDDFMHRCMSSEESQKTFPDSDQRAAFCESQWERKDASDMSVHRLHHKAQGHYRMVNKGSDAGEIWLYGTIGIDWFGDGVTAKKFADDLRKMGKVKAIDLRINSDGGVVTDARAIYNLLVEHEADVTTHIDGIAASAASFVAMAGSSIRIAEGGFVMIHNARGITVGDANDHRHMAEVLDQFNQTIIDTYAARTKQDEKKIKKWMDDETWFTGREAVDNGFADSIVENMRVAACLDPSRFKHLPAALRPNRQRSTETIAATKFRP